MTAPLESAIDHKHKTYSKAEAIREADRCLYCFDPPCVKACPTSIDIPTFIKRIANDNVEGAAKTIFSSNILGYSCAKVCPVEVLCAGSCVYNDLHEPPIEIGRLQDYASSYALLKLSPEDILGSKKSCARTNTVALVGSGPASLAAAALLAHASFKPVIFEKNKMAGGLNAFGIAPYKLKTHEAQREIEWLSTLGIDFRFGITVGNQDVDDKIISLATLKRDFDAIFIGVGLGQDNFLEVDGIHGPGVIGACDAIAKIKTDPSFSLDTIKHAHVIGGGNTAMDIAHELKLLGVPKVTVLYRRGIANMSGYAHERALVQKAGVSIEENVQLLAVIRNGEGRAIGMRTSTSDDVVKTDLVVLAIGQESAQKHFPVEDVPFDQWGRIVVDPQTQRIANTKIWAGGDCVNGGKEVVNAVFEARTAVANIITTLIA